LGREAEGGVLPGVLYYLPRLVANRVNLHPNRLRRPFEPAACCRMPGDGSLHRVEFGS